MSQNESQVVNEILRYLVENPNAQETVEGIAEWWLSERRIGRQEQEVQEALELLVAEGLLVSRAAPDSQVRFRISSGQLPQILERLAEGGDVKQPERSASRREDAG